MTINSVYGNVEAYMSDSDLDPLLENLMRALGTGVQVMTCENTEYHHSVIFSLLTHRDVNQSKVMDAVHAITDVTWGGVSRGVVYFIDLRNMRPSMSPDVTLFDLSRSSSPVVDGTWFEG